LAKHGLAVTQGISFQQGFSDAAAVLHDTLTTSLIHKSGQWIESEMPLHLPKQDPQGQGSAVTYARRYAYMAILGLVADDDDDGNAASRPKVQPKPEPKPHAQPARDLTTELRDRLTAKYGEPIKGKEAVEKILGRSIGKLSELSDAEIAGVMLELG
jgi:hypothetical protein